MDERYVVPARVLAGGCAPVSGICLVCGLSSRCQPLEKCYRAVAPLEPENAESILGDVWPFHTDADLRKIHDLQDGS